MFVTLLPFCTASSWTVGSGDTIADMARGAIHMPLPVWHPSCTKLTYEHCLTVVTQRYCCDQMVQLVPEHVIVSQRHICTTAVPAASPLQVADGRHNASNRRSGTWAPTCLNMYRTHLCCVGCRGISTQHSCMPWGGGTQGGSSHAALQDHSLDMNCVEHELNGMGPHE